MSNHHFFINFIKRSKLMNFYKSKRKSKLSFSNFFNFKFCLKDKKNININPGMIDYHMDRMTIS